MDERDGAGGAAIAGGTSFETVHPGSASAHAAATSASHTDRRPFTITTRRLRPFLAEESIVQSLQFGVANGSRTAPTAGSPLPGQHALFCGSRDMTTVISATASPTLDADATDMATRKG